MPSWTLALEGSTWSIGLDIDQKDRWNRSSSVCVCERVERSVKIDRITCLNVQG